jgi:hypothetical protein
MNRHGMGLILFSSWMLAGLMPGAAQADQTMEAIKDQLTQVQNEIIALQDTQNNKSLSYRRHLHRLVLALTQNQIDDAQKSGNAERVNFLKNEMVTLTLERDSTWDESTAILDAQCKRDQLLADQKIIGFKQQAARAAQANPKKAKEFELGVEAWNKYKPLIDQRYDLEKQLSAAREKEDFKTAADLYQKLKDVRQRQRDVDKSITQQMIQIEEKNSGGEPTSL